MIHSTWSYQPLLYTMLPEKHTRVTLLNFGVIWHICIFHAYASGPPFTKKTPSHKYRNPHYKTKTVWRPSQVYNGDSYTVFFVNRGPGLLHWCWSNLMATIRLPRYHETTRIIWVYKPRTCLLSSTLIGQSYMARLKHVTLKHGNVNFRKAFQLEFVPWIYRSATFPRCCCSYRMQMRD